MKLVRILLITSVIAGGANVSGAAPEGPDSCEQWLRAKFGYSSPQQAARQDALMQNTAFREEIAALTPSPVDWGEQYLRAKIGRSSPENEARQKASLENTAFREETATDVTSSADTRTKEYFKVKLGRDLHTTR